MSYPKCRYCGKVLRAKDSAYVVSKGSKNYYYCNEKEYRLATQVTDDPIVKDIETLIDLNVEIRYSDSWSSIRREIQTLLKKYKSIDIYRYLDAEINYICRSLSRKSFDREYQKIRYMFAIVGNHIQEYLDNNPAPEPQRRVEAKDFYMAPVNRNPNNQRRAMKDIEEWCNDE